MSKQLQVLDTFYYPCPECEHHAHTTIHNDNGIVCYKTECHTCGYDSNIPMATITEWRQIQMGL